LFHAGGRWRLNARFTEAKPARKIISKSGSPGDFHFLIRPYEYSVRLKRAFSKAKISGALFGKAIQFAGRTNVLLQSWQEFGLNGDSLRQQANRAFTTNGLRLRLSAEIRGRSCFPCTVRSRDDDAAR